MKLRSFGFVFVLVTVFFSAPISGAAAEKNSYEYGELVVIHRNSGKLKSSTTVYFFYGDGKEVRSHKSENDPRGLESRREAFKEFIQHYSQRNEAPVQPSIIAVLNMLGRDGWELVQFSSAHAACGKDNPIPQQTYLFKRLK